MKWSIDYVTGNEKIDKQHHDLLLLLQAIYNAHEQKTTQNLIVPLLDNLISHVTRHFGDEERMMLNTDYHYFAEHKSAHDQLLADAVQIIKHYKTGEQLLSIRLILFYTRSLKEHFTTFDTKFFNYIQSR